MSHALQVCMCPGAHGHMGVWEQVDPGARETERECLLDGQGPADAMIAGGLGCSQISGGERERQVTEAESEPTGWVGRWAPTLLPSGPSPSVWLQTHRPSCVDPSSSSTQRGVAEKHTGPSVTSWSSSFITMKRPS